MIVPIPLRSESITSIPQAAASPAATSFFTIKRGGSCQLSLQSTGYRQPALNLRVARTEAVAYHGGVAAIIAQFSIQTKGKATYEITGEVQNRIDKSGVRNGTATVFVQHTSCSLIIMENADPSARKDLEEFFERLVPEDTDYFTHTAEGGDDSTSHIRTVLTRTSETIPIADGKMQLGTWQGIFLFEHR